MEKRDGQEDRNRNVRDYRGKNEFLLFKMELVHNI